MRIRKRNLFYLLAFTSAVIGALVASVDTVVSKLYITDPWVLGLSCFLVGVPISFFITLFLSISTKNKSIGGKVLDPSFRRIRFVRKIELKYHFLAGIGNAVLTIGYFILLSLLGDPSIVLPFSQIVILYLLIVESVTEKNVPTISEIQSSVIVTFGAILGSISFSGQISVEALVVVFLVINPGWVLFSTYQRKLKMLRIDEKPNDSLNIRFWNVVFACLFCAIIVFFYDILSGNQYVLLAIKASITNFGWLALTMGLTFFSYVFYIRALGLGKASVTQAVRSSTIIFVIPFSILLAYLGIIDLFSTDPVMLLIKFIGISLMMLGIVSFALTLVKAYVFITIKPGFSIQDTMNKMWDIRGVNRVSACSGPYDIVAKIHTRALVKGYENIIRKIGDIEGIKDYKWESVLKEWEDI
jgi:DNA-binding Lrp family transcriptional regulator